MNTNYKGFGLNIKPMHYVSDGKSRDNYINYNSGGYLKDVQIAKGSTSSGIFNKRFYSIGYE
jgi:hypothetical protein